MRGNAKYATDMSDDKCASGSHHWDRMARELTGSNVLKADI